MAYEKLFNYVSDRFIPKLEWNLNKKRWISALRLSQFKNKHKNERCFIIGNGPSLNLMDLSPLASEITFGLNRIYLLYRQFGFENTYYVSVNKLVIEQCSDEINLLSMPKFINWQSRKCINFGPMVMFIRDSYDGSLGFSKNPGIRIWEGSTVTYVAMQIAYYMGFRQVILIGIDHSFNVSGSPHQEIVSRGPDTNHFDPNYFGPGFRWQLPDLETSENAYRLAKSHYEQAGREILDATINGKLDIFPKVDYRTLFS